MSFQILWAMLTLLNFHVVNTAKATAQRAVLGSEEHAAGLATEGRAGVCVSAGGWAV